MASNNVVSQLLENETAVFLDVSELLLRFSGNVLRNPTVPKYRSIRLGNTVVQSRILPTIGGLQCLFAMGFQESTNSEYLVLPEVTSLDNMKRIHDELKSVRERKLAGQQVLPAPSTSPSPSPSSSSTAATPSQSITTGASPVTGATGTASPPVHYQAKERVFYSKLRNYFDHVLLYEDKSVQQKARSCIPLSELSQKAGQRMESIQQNLSNTPGEKAPNMRDCLLLELLHWFKKDFFTWTNAPKCCQCNGDTKSVGMVDSTPEERRWGADRVEDYFCYGCNKHTRFPRYNHPSKLLETRTGRCGEWANCFTLCCRAIGFEARYVVDWTDHVWTEVFTESQQRWLHCDPCEDACDKPLIYEVGWGKKLSYVIAFSKDEIVDVIWRYTTKQSEVTERRSECREEWLVQIINRLNKERQAGLPGDRKQLLQLRSVTEIVEFMSIKTVKEGEEQGRSSGSLAWRLARGETGQSGIQHTAKTITLTPVEKTNKYIHIKYSCAADKYQRLSDNNSEINGWSSLLMESDNVFRKEEHDWKMVYLARTEGSDTAKVSWKFDFNDTEFVVSKVTVTAISKTYENGIISWRLCSPDQCVLLNGGEDAVQTDDLEGAKSVTMTAEMSGGRGNIAWQHTQLFRQSVDEISHFPLDIKITLREK
ncbi:peptide-N(4)-(N-acetyl-beta-glucosaminyl)asparagine amidase-like [Glandiceps talaboti]